MSAAAGTSRPTARTHETAGLRDPLAYAGAALVLALAVLLRDPHEAGSWGVCPLNALTGGYCPGCGSLRAFYDLLHGRPAEAVAHNVLALPALGWLAWWWLSQVAAARGSTLAGPPASRRFCWTLLAVLALFTIARNIPGSPLAP